MNCFNAIATEISEGCLCTGRHWTVISEVNTEGQKANNRCGDVEGKNTVMCFAHSIRSSETELFIE